MNNFFHFKLDTLSLYAWEIFFNGRIYILGCYLILSMPFDKIRLEHLRSRELPTFSSTRWVEPRLFNAN